MCARVAAVKDVDIYSRHESIEAYLRTHPDIAAYVVLDADNFFPSHVPLVLCAPQHGMSDPSKVEELRAGLLAARKRAWEGTE